MITTMADLESFMSEHRLTRCSARLNRDGTHTVTAVPKGGEGSRVPYYVMTDKTLPGAFARLADHVTRQRSWFWR